MDRYKVTHRIFLAVIIFVSLLLFGCIIQMASAQNSGVTVIASSEGGYFSFTGDGAYWDFDIDVSGFNKANVDLTNHWDLASSRVVYDNIDTGNIFVRVTEHFPGDEMYYFDWHKLDIKGNGTYTPTPGGGRCVEVTNSTDSVTGWIEYRTMSSKAQFLYDTRHTHADLTVIVHNGELLENATVTLVNGNREVKWTDEDGEADFSPCAGIHHLIVEHPDFSPMLVDDLFFESDKMYVIKVHLTNCTSSAGNTACGASADNLIMYYKEKDPAMGAISPQEYVNYFADKLRQCKGRDNKEADGTLGVMASRWGVFPDPPLNVVLYECNFTKMECSGDDGCLWNITFTVKNYQKYNCNYTVRLIAGDEIVELESGNLGPTWSKRAMHTGNKVMSVKGRENMYLTVVSDKTD